MSVLSLDTSLMMLILLIWSIISLIAHILKLERKGLEIYPLVIIVKSKRIIVSLRKFFVRHKRLIKIYSNFSLRVFPILIMITYVFLAFNVIALILTKLYNNKMLVFGEFQLLMPINMTFKEITFLGIAIFIAIVPHEIMHSLVGLKNRFKIKEIGFFNIFLAFLGGYVEFHERNFVIVPNFYMGKRNIQRRSTVISRLNLKSFAKKVKIKKKIALYQVINLNIKRKIRAIREVAAAGLGVNLIFLLIFASIGIFIIPTITNSLYYPNGVYVIDTTENSIAKKHGISAGTVIYYINSTYVANTSSFLKTIDKYRGKNVTLVTNHGNITIGIPKNGSLGIMIITNYEPKYKFLPHFYDMILFVNFMFSIQFAILILNALPIWISDGAQYLAFLLSDKVKSTKKVERLNFILNFIGISLLITNLALSML